MTAETTAAGPTDEMRPVPASDEIALSETDRCRLYTFIHSGQESGRARIRAQILLKLGEGWSLAEICRSFDVSRSKTPEGHDHWTLRMLANKAVELGFVETISPETIRALLKKTNSSPGGIGSGASRRR